MPSHAEEHFDAIGNYYHIIDPEGTLSEIERAKNVNVNEYLSHVTANI